MNSADHSESSSPWRTRGYLPHWEAGETAQMIGFRLADSLPSTLLKRWQEELGELPHELATIERRKRIEAALDAGHGDAALAVPLVADMVEKTFLHFDGDRYRLQAWVVMPNHVHLIATLLRDWTLADIVHSWKSFSSKKANLLLGRAGTFWAREYFDRVIRDGNHFANAVAYIERNPVSAGLCGRPESWRYSSAWSGRSSSK